MIDSYGWVTITLRALSAFVAFVLIIWQIKIMKPPVKNQWIKYIMLGLVFIMFLNYNQSLILNFFRQPDGNLSINARHFNQIATALVGLASISLVSLLYIRDLDK